MRTTGPQAGTWCKEIWLTDENGDRKRKSFSGPTKKAANDRAMKWHHENGSAAPTTKDMTVAMALQRFIISVNHQVVVGARKPNTLESQKYAAKKIGSDLIAQVTLHKLTASDVDGMVRRLQTGYGRQRGISPSYALQCRSLLSRAIKLAVRDGFVARNVVADSGSVPQRRRRVRTPLTDAGIDALLKVASERSAQDYATIAVLTMGLRRGETLGLQWSDIELDAVPPRMLVRQQLVREKGGPAKLGDLKTPESKRRLEISGHVVSALRALRAIQTDRRSDFVFVSRSGTPVDPSNAYHLVKRFGRDAGIPDADITMHALRHWAVTKALQKNAGIAQVMRQVGHKDHRMTLGVYSHLTVDDLGPVAMALDRSPAAVATHPVSGV